MVVGSFVKNQWRGLRSGLKYIHILFAYGAKHTVICKLRAIGISSLSIESINQSSFFQVYLHRSHKLFFQKQRVTLRNLNNMP